MCSTDDKGRKADCYRCTCSKSSSPRHSPVTQEVTIDGKDVTVRMCRTCGTRL